METILLRLPVGIIKGIVEGEISAIPFVIARHLKPPFKVYIYCSNLDLMEGAEPRLFYIREVSSAPYISTGVSRLHLKGLYFEPINGKVALAFICDKIINYEQGEFPPFNYGWNVSNLTVLDKPLPLSKFQYACPNKKRRCDRCKYNKADKQSQMVLCKPMVTQVPSPWCHIRDIGA